MDKSGFAQGLFHSPRILGPLLTLLSGDLADVDGDVLKIAHRPELNWAGWLGVIKTGLSFSPIFI